MNAAPFFYNANPPSHKGAVPHPQCLRRDFRGPVKKEMLFYFLAYQGVRNCGRRLIDRRRPVPITLDQRSLGGGSPPPSLPIPRLTVEKR